MSIKNDLLGGTDWSDGNILYSEDLNDTLNATLISGENSNLIQSINHTGNKGDTNLIINKCDSTGDFDSSTNLTSDEGVIYSVTDGAFSLETMGIPLYNATTTGFSRWNYTVFDEIKETTLSGDSTDTNDLSSYKKFWIRYKLFCNQTSDIPEIKLTDGSNSVLIKSISASISLKTQTGLMVFFLDWSNKKVYVQDYYTYLYLATSGTPYAYYINKYNNFIVDISAITGSALYLQTVKPTDTVVEVYNIRGKSSSPSTTVSTYLSADNGSNYTEGNSYFSGMTSGSNLKAKISGTIASNEGIEINQHVMKEA